MHVIVLLYMVTWSNTLVYPFAFRCVFLYVLCYLIIIDMFHIQMQLIQRLDL